MFTRQDARNRTIAIEVLGFALVASVIWGNELFDLPHTLFGAPSSPTRLIEAVMESAALLAVATFVVCSTLSLFRRLAERMASLTACSHCQRVEFQGEWMEFNEYIEERLDTRSTYGMCPYCVMMVRGMIAVPIRENQDHPPRS
jgi:hypothetical protein